MNVGINGGAGLPPTVQLDHGLLEILATRPDWLPDSLYHQLTLFRQAFNISTTLGTCESSSTGLLPSPRPVISNFERELRALEHRFSSSWSSTEFIVLNACRMILYTFAISSETPESDSSTNSISDWIVQCYMAAINIIRMASGSQEELRYAPIRMQKMVVNATCFFWLLQTSGHCNLVEENALCDGMSQGRQILGSFSIDASGLMSRTCKLIDQMSKSSEAKNRSEALLRMRSRMGANPALSAVLRARECRVTAREDTPVKDVDQGIDLLSDDAVFADVDWEQLFMDLATCTNE
ncbi:hypothetical protein LTR34_010113 [Exophiala xenobiotica]|nr:hypothetical protein LTR34_010113 [Exophiala xenobiotica]KAK5530767.1 hypothetical protein LTR23_010167 [Chaetothyriales sp. CCFEE 6169]